MNVEALQRIPSARSEGETSGFAPARRSFGDVLAAALDGAADAVEHADRLAGAVAAGSGSVVDASVARAKADVLLEIVSVAASRLSGALNSLIQTQV